MKKILAFIMSAAIILSLSGCGEKTNSNTPAQPNSFFIENENRFLLVDKSEEEFKDITNVDSYVYVDTVTGVTYLITVGYSYFAMTPLLCEDGSPMIYDEF